jgi:hypothetical protein
MQHLRRSSLMRCFRSSSLTRYFLRSSLLQYFRRSSLIWYFRRRSHIRHFRRSIFVLNVGPVSFRNRRKGGWHVRLEAAEDLQPESDGPVPFERPYPQGSGLQPPTKHLSDDGVCVKVGWKDAVSRRYCRLGVFCQSEPVEAILTVLYLTQKMLIRRLSNKNIINSYLEVTQLLSK